MNRTTVLQVAKLSKAAFEAILAHRPKDGRNPLADAQVVLYLIRKRDGLVTETDFELLKIKAINVLEITIAITQEGIKMCNFISKEEARELAGDCSIEGLSQVAVADAVEKAHESGWYRLAKQWAEQPLPMGGETFPRACRFIVSVIDNGWNVMRALMEQYSDDVPVQIALMIEAILLGNFRAIYNANKICPLAEKIGFDIFIEVVVGNGDYSAFLLYLCVYYDSPADMTTSLLACDAKAQCLLGGRVDHSI